MLVRDPDGDTVLIPQTSHAWISGQLARAWRDVGEPREDVILAALQHDIGWAEWDLDPETDPDTGLPRSFMRMPTAARMEIWRPAARRVQAQSLYAALLVSKHGTTLHAGLEGAEAFLAEQHALQEEWIAELGADPEAVEHHRGLIMLWDKLSLALCLRWDPYETDGLALERVEGEAFTLAPWPFAADAPLTVECQGRRTSGELVRLAFTLVPPG
jgi:hypothetical protein